MTPASEIRPGTGLSVLGALFVALAVAVPAAMPGAVRAQECALTKLSEWVSTTTRQEIADENFECLQRRIQALQEEREALNRRIERLEGGEALASSVYRNVDGRILGGEEHFGPATFVLTGDRRGRPRSLELDRARIVRMCGDSEGCLITLGLRGIIVDGDPVEAMFSTGPCAFQIDGESNAWALSGLCAATDLPAASGSGAPAEGQPAWGRDGDARPLGGAASDGRVILGFGGACFLAEAQPDTHNVSTGEARFARDTKSDLFLVTAGADWDPAGEFPAALLPRRLSDPAFQCSLTIRD